MKKSIALVMALSMVLVLLAGCTSAAATTAPASSPAPASANPADSTPASEAPTGGATAQALVPHKLGVIFYGVSDPFAAQVYRDVNRAAKVLGSEVTWAIGSMDPNGQINDAQNLIAAGVQGIMCIPNGETSTQKIMDLCQKNNVSFTICFRKIADAAVAQEVTASANWAGFVNEDQYAMGATVIQHLYDLGARKIGLLLGVGDQSYEVDRNNAYKETAQKLGMEVLATSTPINGTNDAQVATENFLTSYPEMDGIAQVTGAVGQAEMVISTLARLGKTGKVKFGTCDTFTNEYDAFASNGVQISAGGFSQDGLFSFMMLYNAVDGNPWTTEKNPNLTQNALFITSAEECQTYDKYVDTPNYNTYSDDDILGMVKRLHPDVTLASIQALMGQYNFDYVTKHAVPGTPAN